MGREKEATKLQLLCAPPSPFASKVRMAARHLDIPLTEIFADTNNPEIAILEHNPLGKLPVLIRDNGPAIYDSISIMHFLDRLSVGRLYPLESEARNTAEVLEALCDGIMDCLLAIVYESRFRPSEKVHLEWIEKQWLKVTRGLDRLNQESPDFDNGVTGGHFSLAALLGYLELRFGGKWEEGRSALVQWQATFEAVFPPYPAMKPLAS